MLVLDPSRRFTIEQIKHHRWMLIEGASAIGLSCDISNKSVQEPNEQILRLMVGLGIDAQKTRESLKVQSIYYNKQHNFIFFIFDPAQHLRSSRCYLFIIIGTVTYTFCITRQ